jgi:hypothetical protein
MTDHYPGYDVMRKADGPSWNDVTREVVEDRLQIADQPRFFTAAEWETLGAVCERIVPQPAEHKPVPLPAYVDEKMFIGRTDGYRYPGMPPQGEAWRRGLAALDEAALREAGRRFHELGRDQQDAMLQAMQDGKFESKALAGMPSKSFFSHRIIPDIVAAYYAHPAAWNEIGWGGPASPRGYVRLQLGMRDPWEPEEAEPGDAHHAEKVNRRVG